MDQAARWGPLPSNVVQPWTQRQESSIREFLLTWSALSEEPLLPPWGEGGLPPPVSTAGSLTTGCVLLFKVPLGQAKASESGPSFLPFSLAAPYLLFKGRKFHRH